MPLKILVTGGAGFIGSALVRQLIRETDGVVVNVDKLTYAGNLAALEDCAAQPRHHFARVDVCDRAALDALFAVHRPDAVFHLAAESHVDRSIHGPDDFIRSNVVGTFTVLEACRGYWLGLDESAQQRFRLLHVSTDEVYGSLGATGAFTEGSPYQPNSPYSASKAAADHLVRAWHQTYGLPVITTHCGNNYGPYQFPEKLIPRMIHRALSGEDLPIYGSGHQVRDWLHVDDHARALRHLLARGHLGETYNIGANGERSNLAVVHGLCDALDRLRPRADGRSYRSQIEHVADRPGHDERYAIDSEKLMQLGGWRAQVSWDQGLMDTVAWYLGHTAWMDAVLHSSYHDHLWRSAQHLPL